MITENLINSVKSIASRISDMVEASTYDDNRWDFFEEEADGIGIIVEAHSEVILLDQDREANQVWESASVIIKDIDLYDDDNGNEIDDKELLHFIADTLEANIKGVDEVRFN